MTRYEQLLQLMTKMQAAYVASNCGEDFEDDLETVLGIDLDDALTTITGELEILKELEEED